jgi:hypothetical protein
MDRESWNMIGAALIVTALAAAFMYVGMDRLYQLNPLTTYEQIGDRLIKQVEHEDYYTQKRYLLNKGTASSYALVIALWAMVFACLTWGWRPSMWPAYAQAGSLCALGLIVYGIFTGS